jgi:hypothetical protein
MWWVFFAVADQFESHPSFSLVIFFSYPTDFFLPSLCVRRRMGGGGEIFKKNHTHGGVAHTAMMESDELSKLKTIKDVHPFIDG